MGRLWDIVRLTRRRSLAGWSSSKDSLPRGPSSLFATLSFCPHLPRKEEEGRWRELTVVEKRRLGTFR